MSQPVVIAHGDGIGPEIMQATLQILQEAGAELDIHTIDIGLAAYQAGHAGGIPPKAWEAIHQVPTIFKAPITTPTGGGVKSLNVTLRKSLGLAVNVRPVRALHPFVETRHPDMDLTVIRENEEDLYAGIEYRQSEQVISSLKLITRPGCERVARYAFDYAKAHGLTKVTALVKDNIMKMTDGLFWSVCQEISSEYPGIKLERLIVDIGMARVADTPEDFQVIVCENLYGDILSDITAQLAGSVGMAGSANLGEKHSMFEAIHGSAPDLAGKGVANPSGLIMAGVQMLENFGQTQVAERIHNAWLVTLEEGVHTGDIASDHTRKQVGTQEFAEAVIDRLGKQPNHFAPIKYQHEVDSPEVQEASPVPLEDRTLVGVDVFVHYHGDPEDLAGLLRGRSQVLALQSIACRGIKVWPDGDPETNQVDQFCCRYLRRGNVPVSLRQITELLANLAEAEVEWVKTEHLIDFDGQPGYSAISG